MNLPCEGSEGLLLGQLKAPCWTMLVGTAVVYFMILLFSKQDAVHLFPTIHGVQNLCRSKESKVVHQSDKSRV